MVPPKLGFVLQRYNQDCSYYQKAFDSWKAASMPEYENALREAATASIGALEWALKVYLRSVRRDVIAEEDTPKLRQPTFHNLMSLMRKYADPPIDGERVNLLYDYRSLFRVRLRRESASRKCVGSLGLVRRAVLRSPLG